MNWLDGAAWGTLLIVIGSFVHRVIHGRVSGVTPLGVFYTAWIFSTTLYIANPFHLYRLPTRGIVAVIVAVSGFTFAYGIATLASHSKQVKAEPRSGGVIPPSASQLSAFQKAWAANVLLWLFLLVLYLSQIRAYTGSGLQFLLYNVRTSLSTDATPPSGFYYFYFAQILIPFGAVLRIQTGKRVYLWWNLAATFSLVLTSGRTNIIIAILSWAFVHLLAKDHKIRRNNIVTVLFITICVFGVFSFLGNTIGKTYQNSQLYRAYGSHPPVPVGTVQAFFYVSGPLPYFGQLTLSRGGTDHGANLARPFLQLGSVLDPAISPGTNIQPFVGIPFDTNLGTYLSPIWTDFGMVGVLVVNVVLGLLVALSWMTWRARRTPTALVLVAVEMVFCASSILAASFTEVWFLLFLAVVALAGRRRVPKMESTPPDMSLERGKRPGSDPRRRLTSGNKLPPRHGGTHNGASDTLHRTGQDSRR